MKTSGATISVTGVIDRLRSWTEHHRRVCLSTLRDLLENLVSSLLTWLVIGIALALPGILFLILSSEYLLYVFLNKDIGLTQK